MLTLAQSILKGMLKSTNMKQLFYITTILFAVVACSKSEPTDKGSGNMPTNPTITLSKSSVSFDEFANEESISFSATANWNAEIINDRADGWLSVSPQSGAAGNASITIKANDNDTADERSASVCIKAGGTQKTINVVQKQKDALTVTSSKFEVDADGSKVQIEVKANIDFDYSIEESAKDWIMYVGTRAMKSSTLTFDVIENDSSEKREGKIYIQSDEFNEVVTIYQAGNGHAIVISKNEYIVPSEGETITVEVKSNIDVNVEIPAEAEWISENTTRATSTNTYRFDIHPNNNFDQRIATIKFTNKENNLSEIVTVIQLPKETLVVAKDEYDICAYGGRIDFMIITNIDINVTISDSAKEWIIPIERRAIESRQLFFNIKACYNESGREGTITLSGNKLKQIIKVKQRGPQESLDREREALIALYNATGGDNWNNNENWCSNKPIRDWYGVTCNLDGYVSQLWLNNNNLVGDIPPEIGVFTCMNTIKFDKNQITSIPSEIDNLTSLGIFTLSSNPITSLPDEIGNMTNLINLDLSNTNISSLPTGFENLTNIQAIYADNCKFESFPIALCNIPGLGVIRLKNNQMSGEIPEEIGNLTNLIELDISNNNLSGQLPKNMGNLVSLIKLYAQNNQITGTIPSTFCNLSNIDLIYLMNNKMSGTIPQEIVDSDWWPILWYDIWEGNQFTEEEMIIPAPKFSAIDNYGNVVDNSIFAKHKYTVLFRFSTTDVNSVNQLPNIQHEHEAYKDTVGIYCYSLDDNAYTLSLFAESNNYTWPMFCSPKNGTQNRDIPFYSYKHRRPSISIFDNNGIMVYNHLYHSDYYEKELRTFLNKAFHFDADYESTDYSKDGEVVTLQTATEGNGIDLVLMGDGYSDRLIADGTYDDVMRTAMDKFFKIEPYKSFRHLFNVYYVKVVSKNEISVANLETALSSKFWLDELTGDNYAAINYALKAIGEERIDEAMITVILHNNIISDGVCYWYNTDYLNDYGSGTSISYFPYAYNKSNLEALIHHETGGHGFAKLADEYVHDDKGIIAESDVENLKESQSKRGWHKNIDFTDNLSTIRWAKFISDPRYANEDIGAYEGAYYHPYGVWRPAKTSIMVNNIGQYNAPSREAIYYRIHKLAYGADWEYDYEEFVEYDVINRTTSAATRGVPYYPDNSNVFKPSHSPVVMNISWRNAKNNVPSKTAAQ